MLAAAERSPAAAGAHDRDGWVGLYTANGRVEDPVGSRPHVGTAAIGRFYDTFIGPRDITFHRDVDIVVGTTVIRDLELEVKMASTLTMRIPAYLRYDLEDHDGELKVAALQAFWELPAMVGQFLRSGVRAVPAGVQLSKALVTNQGLGGTLGFLSGFRGMAVPDPRVSSRGSWTPRAPATRSACGGGSPARCLPRAATTSTERRRPDSDTSPAARWHKLIGSGRRRRRRHRACRAAQRDLRRGQR